MQDLTAVKQKINSFNKFQLINLQSRNMWQIVLKLEVFKSHMWSPDER